MKKFTIILIYLSLLVVIWYLYNEDFLILPEEINLFYFILSLFFLALGTFAQTIAWKKTLFILKIKPSITEAFCSHGISVFMKYIPGKVMTIVGRAAFISERKKASISETSSASFLTQIIELFAGLILGTIFFLFVTPKFETILTTSFSILCCLLFIIFYKRFVFFCIRLASLFNKKINIPLIEPISILKNLPVFFLHWSLWGLGFFLMAKSIFNDIEFYTIFLFPIATVIGVVAIISPGGIGIRESAIVTFLILSGVKLEIATTIAVFSRLWFLCGDTIIFCLSLISKRNLN